MMSRSSRGSDVARAKLYGSEFSVGGEVYRGDWILGTAFRYADSRLKIDARDSRSDLDNYQLGAYVARGFRLGCNLLKTTFGLAGGYHDIKSRRNAWISGERLRADYDAWSLDALAEAELRFDLSAGRSIAPYIALNWDSVWTDSFRERGGQAALRSKSEHQGNLSSTLGVRYAARLGVRASADLDLGWRHTYGNVRPGTKLDFANAPGRNSFTTIGSALARDEFLLGAGVQFDVTERVSLRLDYDFSVDEKTMSHRGTGSVGIGF